MRALHTKFRFAFLRFAAKEFKARAFSLGAILYGIAFDKEMTAEAFRKACTRDGRGVYKQMFAYARRRTKSG